MLRDPEAVWWAGSCHCGGVRFRVRVQERRALDCNCSICKMKGFVHLIVPPEDFVLERGAELLTTYTFNTRTAKHTFCCVCGIHPFYVPRSHPTHMDVNLRCLESVTPADFIIEPFDGANWERSVESLR